MNPLRIGVFICDCDGQLAKTIEMQKIRHQLQALDDVAEVISVPYGCSPDGEQAIQKNIRAHGLNRVVLLGCSPRMMEKRFQKVCNRAGLNPSLLEIVNLRDQCAWVHQDNNGTATPKAWSMVQAGIGKARKLNPVEPLSAKIYPEVAIVGGGIAGLTTALSLTHRDISVTIIEKNKELGGITLKLTGSTPSTLEAKETASRLASALESNSMITLFTDAKVANVSGSYGDYRLVVESNSKQRSVKCGAIVMATGTKELKPDRYHGYGGNPKVITLSELEQKLTNESELVDIQNVVMIQCVGARNNERPYCGRTCCLGAVECAIALKDIAPKINVTILHRNMPPDPGPDPMLLSRARELDVKFTRVSDRVEPKVAPKSVYGKRSDSSGFRIPYDLVVLSSPPIPSEGSRTLAEKLRLPVDEFGFIPESSPNLKPHMYTPPAILVAGSAHWPCTLKEASYQGYSCAAQLARLIQQGEVVSTRDTAHVNVDACRGCKTCYDVCPFDVPVIKSINGNDPVSTINPFLCKGCGLCVVHCPSGAATMTNLDDDTIYATIEAALTASPAGSAKIIAFLCEWSGYAAADLAGVKRQPLPPEVIPLRIPCGGRLSASLILHSFLHGADGVIACICRLGDCHYRSGNFRASEMIRETESLIDLLGIDRQRFQMIHSNPENYKEFAHDLTHFVKEVKSSRSLQEVSKDGKTNHIPARQNI